ncbi:ChaN family lipoprotein [Geotalea uraniireducens]|nr:ChaN family lipoprotein [Geotalea uraniireducens]
MGRRAKMVVPLAVLAAVILLAVASRGHDLIVRVKDNREIPFHEMVREIKAARLVYVGEIHDVQADHDFQLRVIRALAEAGVPLAIGMEMFTAESQEALDRWTAGALAEKEFREVYYRNWQMPWHFYGAILCYAREKRIPVVGLNIPREIARKVARHGFASLAPEEKARLVPNVTCDVNSAYMEMVRRAYADHAPEKDLFRNFCEAQQLWNKSMAFHIVRFARRNPGRTMVVITGAGHAIRGGIPAEVAGDDPALGGWVILPDSRAHRGEVTVADADYLWLTH